MNSEFVKQYNLMVMHRAKLYCILLILMMILLASNYFLLGREAFLYSMMLLASTLVSTILTIALAHLYETFIELLLPCNILVRCLLIALV